MPDLVARCTPDIAPVGDEVCRHLEALARNGTIEAAPNADMRVRLVIVAVGAGRELIPRRDHTDPSMTTV